MNVVTFKITNSDNLTVADLRKNLDGFHSVRTSNPDTSMYFMSVNGQIVFNIALRVQDETTALAVVGDHEKVLSDLPPVTEMDALDFLHFHASLELAISELQAQPDPEPVAVVEPVVEPVFVREKSLEELRAELARLKAGAANPPPVIRGVNLRESKPFPGVRELLRDAPASSLQARREAAGFHRIEAPAEPTPPPPARALTHGLKGSNFNNLDEVRGEISRLFVALRPAAQVAARRRLAALLKIQDDSKFSQLLVSRLTLGQAQVFLAFLEDLHQWVASGATKEELLKLIPAPANPNYDANGRYLPPSQRRLTMEQAAVEHDTINTVAKVGVGLVVGGVVAAGIYSFFAD